MLSNSGKNGASGKKLQYDSTTTSDNAFYWACDTMMAQSEDELRFFSYDTMLNFLKPSFAIF